MDRDQELERLAKLAHRLDSQFRIPGTGIRFGADSILGLVPFRATPIGLKGLPGVGLGFAPVLGAMFAIVWLPCVGPVLGAILTMASSSTSPLQGGLLLVVYTIGFGLPFVAAALMWQVALRAFRLVSNHRRAVNAVAGLVMVGIGIAMLLGWWTWFTQWAQLQAVELFY